VQHVSEKERVGITPKSWTAQRHHGVLHLGKRWYVLSADIDEAGTARGVRLDGPYTQITMRRKPKSSGIMRSLSHQRTDSELQRGRLNSDFGRGPGI
jgi:hypothetical protein